MREDSDPARDLVMQILRTGLTLTDIATGLAEDLPDDAFPGESVGDVLVEMLTGTIRPAALAAGEPVVRQTTALLGAVVDRTVDDLRAACEISRRQGYTR